MKDNYSALSYVGFTFICERGKQVINRKLFGVVTAQRNACFYIGNNDMLVQLYIHVKIYLSKGTSMKRRNAKGLLL